MLSHIVSRPLGWLGAPLFRWSIAIIAAVIAGAFIFEGLHISVFSLVGFPHEYCYLQQPTLVWLHVIADLLIGLAYVSISATLGYLVYRASKDIPFNWVFLAFGLFIISCGFTHFMEVWVIWKPVYWLSGYVKVVTAAASVATAIALFPLVPKIFDLIAAARKSEQRRQEIERLNEDLERFNYSVAHDLRAPLRSIMGFGDAAIEDYGSRMPPEAQAYINRIKRSADRMDALVTGLLRYATIGRQQIALQATPLDEPLRTVVQSLEREIHERKAVVELPATPPPVVGDPALLHVVFQNLIANAIKFVGPGVTPRVTLTWKPDGSHILVCITDNGTGFPPEALKRVFGMFERFHHDHPGTGIGLATVKRAIKRMKGEIGIEPSPAGHGTLVWLRLRRA